MPKREVAAGGLMDLQGADSDLKVLDPPPPPTAADVVDVSGVDASGADGSDGNAKKDEVDSADVELVDSGEYTSHSDEWLSERARARAAARDERERVDGAEDGAEDDEEDEDEEDDDDEDDDEEEEDDDDDEDDYEDDDDEDDEDDDDDDDDYDDDDDNDGAVFVTQSKKKPAVSDSEGEQPAKLRVNVLRAVFDDPAPEDLGEDAPSNGPGAASAGAASDGAGAGLASKEMEKLMKMYILSNSPANKKEAEQAHRRLQKELTKRGIAHATVRRAAAAADAGAAAGAMGSASAHSLHVAQFVVRFQRGKEPARRKEKWMLTLAHAACKLFNVKFFYLDAGKYHLKQVKIVFYGDSIQAWVAADSYASFANIVIEHVEKTSQDKRSYRKGLVDAVYEFANSFSQTKPDSDQHTLVIHDRQKAIQLASQLLSLKLKTGRKLRGDRVRDAGAHAAGRRDGAGLAPALKRRKIV
jgi:hypothetical protein